MCSLALNAVGLPCNMRLNKKCEQDAWWIPSRVIHRIILSNVADKNSYFLCSKFLQLTITRHGLPQPNLGWGPRVLRKPKAYHQCIGSGDSKSRFSANSIVGKFLLHSDLASLHFNTRIFPTIDFDKSYIFVILRVHINLLCSCFP